MKNILALFALFFALFLLSPTYAHAQWVQASGQGGSYVYAFAVSGANLFAGTSGGIVLSTNNGTSWTAVNTGLTNTYVYSLSVSGTNLFAGTDGAGVFLSTNDGTSWTAVNSGLTFTYVRSLGVSGTSLFAGTYGGVFLSTNNGTSWTQVNSGLTNTVVGPVAVSGTNLFAGTGGGVWRRPLSEMITSVERLSTELLTHFSLDQNYPNPFNPSTKIGFTVPSQSCVSLKVYDLLGREVAALVREVLLPGSYEATFDGSRVSRRTGGGLASGVYFYRMTAGNYSTTKKMFLMK